MFTMQYDIQVGQYHLGMLHQVQINSSVELLADTATITLPAAEYNKALLVERQISRGDKVCIRLGYAEAGLIEEFRGYLLRIATDGGSITLHCEDELFLYRKPLKNAVHKAITLDNLLKKVCKEIGVHHSVDCSYAWTYHKFVVHATTAYDLLKKIQDDCAADIYIQNDVLHIHPPGHHIGAQRYYDMALNLEQQNLVYQNEKNKKLKVLAKALLPNGEMKQIEVGHDGGDQIEIKCPTTDSTSMKQRALAELKRRTYDGYEGSITAWLIPQCRAGDSATIRDEDYPDKDGTYFVLAVKTSMSASGGKREIQLGHRLS